jgi:uncharacterized LabA/DUF88 family protein
MPTTLTDAADAIGMLVEDLPELSTPEFVGELEKAPSVSTVDKLRLKKQHGDLLRGGSISPSSGQPEQPEFERPEPDPGPAAEPMDVGIFWDFENVRPPRGYSLAKAAKCLRSFLLKQPNTRKIGPQYVYYDSRKISEQSTDRVGLSELGFHMIDCPSRSLSQKETIDKKLIVDAMEFGCEVENGSSTGRCVVLITSDGDFTYMLSKLHAKRVHTVLIHGPETSLAELLLEACDRAHSFNYDILDIRPHAGEDDALALPGAELDGGVADDFSDSDERFSDTASERELAVGGYYYIFLVCVLEVLRNRRHPPKVTDRKARDFEVSKKFNIKKGYKKPDKKPVSYINQEKYKQIREAAVRGGFLSLEYGKKTLHQDHSTTLFLRLTEAGYAHTQGEGWTREADESLETQRRETLLRIPGPPAGSPPDLDLVESARAQRVAYQLEEMPEAHSPSPAGDMQVDARQSNAPNDLRGSFSPLEPDLNAAGHHIAASSVPIGTCVRVTPPGGPTGPLGTPSMATVTGYCPGCKFCKGQGGVAIRYEKSDKHWSCVKHGGYSVLPEQEEQQVLVPVYIGDGIQEPEPDRSSTADQLQSNVLDDISGLGGFSSSEALGFYRVQQTILVRSGAELDSPEAETLSLDEGQVIEIVQSSEVVGLDSGIDVVRGRCAEGWVSLKPDLLMKLEGHEA